jgi:hypothetical protein
MLKNLWIVVSSSLTAGLLAAWVAIPFLTTEAGYVFFLIGGTVGFVGSLLYVLRRTGRSPDVSEPP